MPAQPYRAFGPAGVAAHQRRLVGALNHPVLGRWLKRALRIRSCDLGYALPIVAIRPHYYTVLRDRRQRRDGRWELALTTDFRTHWKYSKRVYHAGKAIWWALHAWDQIVANPLVPQWNLGYDLLTVHPDPNPEVTSVDGRVHRGGVDETWATIIAGAGNEVSTSGAEIDVFRIQSSATTDQWDTVARSFFLFDTSPLGHGVSVSAVVLSLASLVKVDNLSIAPNVDIFAASPASDTNLVDADFSTLGALSQTGSPLSFAAIDGTPDVYNPFTLDQAGRNRVDRVGISRFGGRNVNYDVDAVAPSWSISAASDWDVRSADFAGLTSDPKLEVTYTIVTWLPPQTDAGASVHDMIPSGFIPPDFPEA